MNYNIPYGLTWDDLAAYGHKTAKEIARMAGIPRQPHPAYADLIHPTCETPGCTNEKIVCEWHWITGEPIYRSVCNECHEKNTARRYAEKTGATWVSTIKDVVAHKAGFNSSTEYTNSKHPYLKYRKDFCENVDGRLGFVCTTTIIWSGQLDVDHIDENPSNNTPNNLQTLCKCCHAVKSNQFVKENGKTPGRKTLGITY